MKITLTAAALAAFLFPTLSTAGITSPTDEVMSADPTAFGAYAKKLSECVQAKAYEQAHRDTLQFLTRISMQEGAVDLFLAAQRDWLINYFPEHVQTFVENAAQDIHGLCVKEIK